jgi:hypothetical protein
MLLTDLLAGDEDHRWSEPPMGGFGFEGHLESRHVAHEQVDDEK